MSHEQIPFTFAVVSEQSESVWIYSEDHQKLCYWKMISLVSHINKQNYDLKQKTSDQRANKQDFKHDSTFHDNFR